MTIVPVAGRRPSMSMSEEEQGLIGRSPHSCNGPGVEFTASSESRRGLCPATGSLRLPASPMLLRFRLCPATVGLVTARLAIASAPYARAHMAQPRRHAAGRPVTQPPPPTHARTHAAGMLQSLPRPPRRRSPDPILTVAGGLAIQVIVIMMA